MRCTRGAVIEQAAFLLKIGASPSHLLADLGSSLLRSLNTVIVEQLIISMWI